MDRLGNYFTVIFESRNYMWDDEEIRVTSVRNITEQKRAEIALKESEERFRQLSELSSEGVVIHKNGKIVDCNSSFEKVIQYKRKELIGRYTNEFLAPQSIELSQKRLKMKHSLPEILYVVRKDGKEIALEVEFFDTIWNNDKVRVTYVRDKTERLKAEKALKESEERFKKLASLAFEGVLLHRNGIAVEMNPTFEKMFGYNRSEMVGGNLIQKLIPEKYHPLIMKNIVKQIADPYECEAIKKDGSLIPVEIESQTLVWDGEEIRVTSIRDITKQKHDAQALKESQERYKLLSDATFEGVALGKDGKFIDANDQVYQIYGYTPEEFIKLSLEDFIHPDDLKMVWDKVKRNDLTPYEHRGVRKDGTQIFVEIRAKRVFVNNIEYRMTVFRDITDRKKMELFLRESEEQNRMLLENLPTVVWKTDQNGKTSYISPNVEKIIGFSMDEIYQNGKKIWLPRIHQDDKAKVQEGFKQLFSGLGEFNVEYRIKHKNGSWLWLHDRSSVTKKEEETVYAYGVFSDVTERKNAEVALKASERKFKSVFHTSFTFQGLLEPNGKVIDINQTALSFINKDISEIKGEYFWETPWWEASNEIRERIKQSIKKGQRGEVSRFNIENTNPKGEILITDFTLKPYFDENGQVVYLIPEGRDVTSLLETQEALAKSESMYRNLLKTLPDAVTVIDLGGTITYCSERTSELHGYEHDELVGKSMRILVSEKELQRASENMTQMLLHTNEINHFEAKMLKKDGSEFVGEVTSIVMRDSDNVINSILSVSRDITWRKKAEQAMILAERASRLASMGTLAAGIAHEINQPLTAIKVKVDGLLYWGEEDEAIMQKNLKQNLEFISLESEKIDEIVQHMRQLARPEAKPKLMPIDINKMIPRALSLLKQQVSSHNIELVYDFANENPTVLAIDTPFQQVIINLVVNAMQALDTTKGSKKIIEIATRVKENKCIITCSDSGPGIPNDILNKIFDPFFTTKLDQKGMGLGLPIIQNFISSFNGKISAENGVNGGAVFTIELDLSHENQGKDYEYITR